MKYEATFYPNRDVAPERLMSWAIFVKKVVVHVSADNAEEAVARAKEVLPELKSAGWPVLRVVDDSTL